MTMSTNLELVKKVDSVPYPHEVSYTSFVESATLLLSHDRSFQLGFVTEDIKDVLLTSGWFTAVAAKQIQFSAELDTLEKRELALEQLGENWKLNVDNYPAFQNLSKAWRNEKYIIYDNKGNHYFKLERSMCPYLGVLMYGVHITGYTVDDDGYKIWVPRRAMDKPTFPGMLDNTVAGGLGYPHGPFETCVKECYEEAGLSESFVRQNLKSVGVISYLYNDMSSGIVTIQPEAQYIYDINMANEVPHPVDGESENFQLMDLKEIKFNLASGKFKDNCAAVLIDFMIRHSILTPENEPDFIEINNRLHRYLPVPMRKN